MGYHDLSERAFLSVAIQETNSSEEAILFQQWLDRTTEITKRLIEAQKQSDVTYKTN